MIRRLIAAVAPLALICGVLAAAPAAQASTRTDLRLARATSGAVVNGSTVTFRGTAPGALNGSRVSLLRKMGPGGRAVNVGSAVISRGAFTIRGRATGMGGEYWQVVSSKSGVTHVSSWLRTPVYSWLPLSSLTMVQTQVDNYPGQCTGGCVNESWRSDSIAGRNYESVWRVQFYQVGPAWGQWNLGYKCSALDTSYGMSDSTTSGFVGAFSVDTDGVRTQLNNEAPGQVGHTVINLAGIYRLTLRSSEAARPSGGGTAYADWGNPMVLCNAQP